MRQLLFGWNVLVLALLLGGCGGGEDPGGEAGAGGEIAGTGGSGGAPGTGGGGPGTGGTGGDPGTGGGGPGTGGSGGSGGSPGTGGSGGGPECLENLDCPEERPECADGVCQGCTANAGCEGRGVCERDSGLCVECLEDFQCGADRECIDNVCTDCTSNEQCPSGLCGVDGKCQPPQACNDDQCPPGFACQRSADLCWPACDHLAEETTCVGGNVCAILGVDAGELLAACVPESGTAQAGEPCGEDAETNDCSLTLICSPEPAGRFCRTFCDPASEEPCGDEGMECELLPIEEGGNQAEAGICRPPARECENASECEADEVCSFGICFPKEGEGAKGPGEACAEDEECATNSCLGYGHCSGTCATGADCAADTECALLTFSSEDGESFEATACVPPCDLDADCPAANYCIPIPDAPQEKMISTCLGQAVGGKAAGEACTVDMECRSGDCSGGPLGGYCVGRCTQDADCAGDRLLCRDRVFSTQGEPIGRLSMCGGPDCDKEADCDDWSCAPRIEGDPPSMVFTCEPPLGAGSGGSVCSAGNDCRSGVCLGAGLGCMELCENDIDCWSGQCVEGPDLRYDGTSYGTLTCL